MSRRILDISMPLDGSTPLWPGDPPVELTRLADIGAGDVATMSSLSLGCHSGTHVDAPAHFLAGGADASTLSLDTLIGPAWVADLDAVGSSATPRTVGRTLLDRLPLPTKVTRLLLKTRGRERGRHRRSTPSLGLSAAGAAWLVERGIRLFGIDSMSVAYGAHMVPAHRALLRAGVIVVEGLDLCEVEPGAYDLVCLPLRLPGAEGAPARAVLLCPAGRESAALPGAGDRVRPDRR